MNLYIDARALQKRQWRGQQLYINRMLDEMTEIGRSHTFHLHFGWDEWHPRIDDLIDKPNVVCHEHRGRVRSHASLPLEILRTRSRIYFRMYNEDSRLRVPIPSARVALVLDNGRHLFPGEYAIVNAPELRRATRRHISSFDLIITISHTVKGEIVGLFGVDPDRIVVAPCAVDPPAATAPAEQPPALAAETPFVLMVNPGGANKNWQDALTGFARFARARGEGEPVLLVLAGGLASEKERIEHAIRSDALLSSVVVCLGHVPDEQLIWLYRHARLALYPSRYEGFGIPVLEAFAYGLPIIASDIPVLREVGGEAAYFVPLGEPEAMAAALERLLTDDLLRAQLIARGHERVHDFSWQDSARTTLDALTMVAER